MLKIDMAKLAGKELEREVARCCSCYGIVKSLRVYPANGTLARPFALVDMETPGQAESLAHAFGRRAMGNSVVVILQQEQAGLRPRNGPVSDNTLELILKELKSQS